MISIKTADLTLEDVSSDNQTNRFLLKSKRDPETFELTAATADQKQIWMKQIQNQLDSQLDFVNGVLPN